MNAMTEQTYRPIILSKYTAVLKSCRNLISSEDIRLIRKAFKIAIQNETEASELNYQEIVRILDITLIITQEIGLGRTSIICAGISPRLSGLILMERKRNISVDMSVKRCFL